jgi:hypothetical protein
VKNAFPSIAILVMVVFTCGCSSQTSSSQDKGPASGAAGACAIDARAVCQSIRNQPIMEMQTGLTADPTRRAQNSTGKTATVILDYPLSSGNRLALECYINTQNSAVVYAKASPGKPLSTEDVDLLRSEGMCKQ